MCMRLSIKQKRVIMNREYSDRLNLINSVLETKYLKKRDDLTCDLIS